MKQSRILSLSALALAMFGPSAFALDTITINGFLTAAATYTDSKDAATDAPVGYGQGLADDEFNTDTRDTRLGIQIAADINDRISLTAQLLAKGGEEQFNTYADWAYASINLDEGIDLRIGKVKVPQFLVSDYQEVGYAYPWLRPPMEVYSTNPITSLSGVDLLFFQQMGDVGLTFQLYAGGGNHTTFVPAPSVAFTRATLSTLQSNKQQLDAALAGGFINQATFDAQNAQLAAAAQGLIGTACSQNLYLMDYEDMANQPCITALPVVGDKATFSTNKMVGFNLSLSNDYATFRIGYFTTRVDAPGFGMYDKYGSFGGVGFSLDWNDIVILSEYIARDTERDMVMDMAFPDQNAGYLTLGYRFGDFLPYITHSRLMKGKDEPVMAAMSSVVLEQTSNSIGMRYEVGPAAAIKFEATRITPEEGNHGLYDYAGVESGNLYGISLDLIF